jgi:membrane protease subunit HflK
MSDEPHHHHPPGEPGHSHPPFGPEADPGLTEDAGSRALAEALRSSFQIVRFVMVLLVILFFALGFFEVGPRERKVILHFGKPGALLGPGLHWAFPAPIDEVVQIPYAQSLTVTSTVGWYHLSPEDAAAEALGYKVNGHPTLEPGVDGYTLVGDGNIIHARASLSYHVDDPIRYKFDFVNASNTIQSALDNALIYASASFTNVDDVLRNDKIRFQETVQARVGDLVQREGLGIAIEQCQVDEVPPLVLRDDFERVTSALANRETDINNALSAQSTGTNAAATEASRIVIAAETDRQQMLTNLEADVNLFNQLQPMYRTNAALVKSIFLARAVTQVMTNVGSKWFIPATPGQRYQVRIQTGPDPETPKAPVPRVDLENQLN